MIGMRVQTTGFYLTAQSETVHVVHLIPQFPMVDLDLGKSLKIRS